MRSEDIRSWLVERVVEQTGARREDIDLDAPISSLGVNSVAVADLAVRLSGLLEADVHPALLFEYPTITALSQALAAPVGTGPWAAARVEPRSPRRPGGPGPVAIVGLAARVPGATTVDAFWTLLNDGRNTVSTIPATRWPAATGLAAAERGAGFGGLLDDVESFDAEFFRMTPEEAARTDPQQRLLLQGAWEGLEDAGIVPSALAGSRTGVYVGISTNDYARRQVAPGREAHALTPTGNALSVAANRISYTFDLRGPSLAVDTACSSSLVAVHLALQDLRSGHCDLAMVAGVNLLIEPETSLALARAGMLSPGGRCRPFDAAADGYVRGEGCLVAVLKPLEQAQADGDRIYAVVLGSAVNQDGRSNGLTAPNPAAQEAVIREAHADAGTSPSAVQYVECHGTGTLLGDPIEARALGAVVGPQRPGAAPCLIGSVKSNLGHLESAAGLAGLAKTALSLYHGHIPATLHQVAPNPHIEFDRLGLGVAAAGRSWPAAAGPRLAGVSSFGFGGTNAHVVLGGPVEVADPVPSGAPSSMVLPVSGRHRDAVVLAAEALAQTVSAVAPAELPALVSSASVRRTHHAWRRAVIGATPAELVAALREIDDAAPVGPLRRLVFAFPGQSGHAPQALLDLAAGDPLVAATLRRYDEILDEEAGWSPLQILARPDAEQILRADTTLAQPMTVLTQLLLATAWRSLGIEPHEVIGHSIGEVAAAAVAGALTPEQALRVGLARGQVISGVIGTGRMLALAVDRAAAMTLVAASGGRIELCTVNGPDSVVVSGDGMWLEKLRAEAEVGGTLARWVPVDYPSHSARMDEPAALLAEALSAGPAPLTAGPPRLPFWSAALGGSLTQVPDAAYWARNLRSPVLFADAAAALLAQGPCTVVELGVHPVLASPLRQLIAQRSADAQVLTGLQRGADPGSALRAGLARLYELGADPAWERVNGRHRYRPLPTYPWRGRRHWLERPSPSAVAGADEHPLLGRRLDLAVAPGTRRRQWERDLTDVPGLVSGHVVAGRPVLPGAAYLEMALAAGRSLGITGPIEVRDARFLAMLPLDAERTTVQTLAESRPGAAAGESYAVTILSRTGDGPWTTNATAAVSPAASAPTSGPVPDPARARAQCPEPVGSDLFYETLASLGLDYAGDYRLLHHIVSGTDTAVATVPVPTATVPGLVLDPRRLDGALQVTAAASGLAPGIQPVLTGVDRLVVAGGLLPAVRIEAVARIGAPDANGTRRATVALYDGGPAGSGPAADQMPLATLEGIGVVARRPPEPPQELFWYRPVWRSADREAGPGEGRDLAGSVWLLAAPGAGDCAGVADLLRGAGADVRVVEGADVHWPAVFAGLRAEDVSAPDVAFVAADASPVDGRRVAEAVSSLAGLVRGVSEAQAGTRRLWVLTSGAQLVPDAPRAPSHPGQGALWGLTRALPFENAALGTYAIDLESTGAAVGEGAGGRLLLDELRAPSAESEIALRAGRRYVARLVRTPEPSEPSEAGPGPDARREVVRPGAGYLVTGGLGALGLHVAQWLAERGAGHIGLLGRSAPGAEARRAIQRLEQLGTKVRTYQADVTSVEAVTSAAAELRRLGALRGVVHAAGVLADGPLLSMPRSGIEAVLAPKVGGALAVEAATAADDLDWTVYFSSAASLLGSPGQANYCAANAFLDSHATARSAAGRSVVTLNWGAWAEGGLAVDAQGRQGPLAEAFTALRPGPAIAGLERALRAGVDQAMVLASDLRHLVRYFPSEVGAARFRELAPADDVALRSIGLGSSRADRPPLARPYVAPRGDIERRIVGIWQRSLGFDRIGVDDGFFELGGDSVFGNQMVLEVNRALGVGITAAAAFEQLTVARLAELAEEDMLRRLADLSDDEAARLLDPGPPEGGRT